MFQTYFKLTIIKNELFQAFFPGVCYDEKEKYCPTKLFTCHSPLNYGYNYTVKGQ